MKRVLLAILMVLFSTSVWGAYNNTAVCTPYTIDNNRTGYSCAFTDSVAGSATEEFRINADASKGRIVEVYWESASEDCDIWISESVDAIATDADTIYHNTAINLGMSDGLSPQLSYYNTSGEYYLYVTIQNDGAMATGMKAILKIVYDRGL